jgi:dolichol-phosphate mannosyltransferase
VRLFKKTWKAGIGGAYQEGFRYALREFDPEVLVEMDADLQHPASLLPQLVSAISDGAGAADGSRYVEGGGISDWSRGRRVMSRTANVYARGLLRLGVRDGTSGFRAYSREAAERVASAELPAKGYEFQVASLYYLKSHFRIVEIPFIFGARAAGKSKLGVGEGLRFLLAVPKIAIWGRG